MSNRRQFLLGTAVLSLLATGSADASELCVKCTGPDASYACVVGDTSNATLDAVSKFYCITSLAKAGSHASCSIDRNVNPPCPGERRELPIPAFLNGSDDDSKPGNAQPAPQNHSNLQTHEANVPQGLTNAGPVVDPVDGPVAGPAASPPDGPDAGPPPQNEPPPKTVQEMMEKSAKSAGNGLSQTQKTAGSAAKSASTALEKAGSAVGGAAKNSWKCLSSFFSNC